MLLRRENLRDTGDFSDPKFDRMRVATAILNGEPQDSPASWDGPTWSTMGNGEFLSNAEDLRDWIRALAAGRILDRKRMDILWPRYRETQIGRRISPSGGGVGGNATVAYYPDRDIIVVIFSNVMAWKEKEGQVLELIVPAEEARDELEKVLSQSLSSSTER
jgi:hypothetical protein